MTTDETIKGKFARIAREIETSREWRAMLAGTNADVMQALEEIAKHYGGENWHTGGGIYVVVIPLGPHDCMGVTGEVICRYSNSKSTDIEDIFYEPENDTSEGIVSLCGGDE